MGEASQAKEDKVQPTYIMNLQLENLRLILVLWTSLNLLGKFYD